MSLASSNLPEWLGNGPLVSAPVYANSYDLLGARMEPRLVASTAAGLPWRRSRNGCPQAAQVTPQDNPLAIQKLSLLADALGISTALVTAQVARILEETVSRWDGEELANKLEIEIGHDLQFVRLNGTLVGGLLGAILHLLTSLI
jgi:Protein of unknown function (DUF445)